MTPAKKRETAKMRAERRVKLNIVIGRLYEIEDDLRVLGVLQGSYRARDLALYVKGRLTRSRRAR